MLEFKDFSYSFDKTPVLAGIGFALPAGGFLSVIGPNGAGKSVLLKCALRLHDEGRAGGRIFVNGQDAAGCRQRDLARLIAYVPQAGGWIPPCSVDELVRLSRYPHLALSRPWGKKDQDAAERALQLTGMEKLRHKLLLRLSGGERQKAYLAAALAQESPMILLDEPASFLDPRHAAELSALLRRLNREEKLTLVSVTHDLNQPLALGGDVLVLRGGRQLFHGPAASLMSGDILEKAYAHGFSRFQHPHTGRPVILAEEL